MNLTVMQPYFFPYLGYFQLVNAVDCFVFYDDVTFIKNGWINRNKMLINNEPHYLTVPCKKISSNSLINEIKIDKTNKSYRKFPKTVQMAYKKAPYFDDVFPILEQILQYPTDKISELTALSIQKVSAYLELNTTFKMSSKAYSETKGLERTNRLIAICQKENAAHYINAVGGQELYEKAYFAKYKVQLDFIQPRISTYQQFGDEFVPNLSIIDVLMFNTKEEVREMVNQYTLI